MSLALLERGEVTGKFASKKLQRTYIPVIQKHVGSTRAEDHILLSDQQVFASSRSSEESQDFEAAEDTNDLCLFSSSCGIGMSTTTNTITSTTTNNTTSSTSNLTSFDSSHT